MKAISATEFLALDGLRRDYIIPGLVPEVGRIALCGVPKRGKSFLALQVALSVCQGIPFLGHEVVKPGPVLYLQFDTPPEMWQERLMKLRDAGQSIPDNLYTPHPSTMPKRVNILDGGHMHALHDMVMATLPALIVVDVLRSIHHLSENESEHMQQVISRLTNLCAGRALLLVHHTSKPNMAPGAGEQSPSLAGRGSSYLGGEMDANWLLRGRQEGRAVLAIEARFAAPFEEISLIQGPLGLWVKTIHNKGGRPAAVDITYKQAVELDPELPTLSVREAAQRSGLSKSTISRERK